MNYLKKSAVCIAALLLAANSFGVLPYNAAEMPAITANAADIVASGDCGAEGDNVTWELDSEGMLTISGTGEMDSWALNLPWSEHSANISKVTIEKGVTAIGEQAFSGCEKITEITIPDSVTSIKTGAFYECINLTSITIPESVTEMGHSVFYGCSSLKDITIPDSIDTINSGVFRECASLETITFSKNVNKVDFTALCSCSNLKSVIFENPKCKIADAEYTICNSHDFDTKENTFNGTIYGYENSTAQAYAEKYNRKFVALEEKPAAEIVASGECGAEGDNVTWKLDSEGTLTIGGDGAMNTTYFGEQELGKDENGIIPVDIKKVVIEDGVTSISGTAFNGYRMTEIEIADSVTSIGKFAFYNCPNLIAITLPKNLKEISLYAFTDCTALKNITIPASVAVIGESPFYGCTSLNKIIVEDNNSNYVSVDGVLYTKDMTRIISYPIGKTLTEYNIPDTVKEIGGGTFGCETDLTNITIPDSVTYIGEEAFSECNGITSITIPKNVESIREYTFFKCAALEKIVIENPDCIIYDYSYTICNTAKSLTSADSKYQGNYDGTIYGYENSTAQAYAEKYNRKFVALEEKPTTAELGDVNGDDSVDSSDASLVLAEYARIQTGGAGEFTESQLKSADVNNDSVVDSSDASKILAYYAMISTGKEPEWD